MHAKGDAEPPPLRAQSRAEGPPSSRLAITLGAVVVAALCVAFAVKLSGKRPVNVPLGLLGLRFGMTVATTRAVLPSLEPVGDAEENRYRARTKLFDEPASCELGFGTEAALSRVECRIDPPTAAEREALLCDKLLETLKSLYGKESGQTPTVEARRWEWNNERAGLHLTCRHGAASPDGAAVFEVTNFSRSRQSP